MASPVEALQAGGFSEDEIAAWATERRGVLTTAGFKENEIDAYFTGGVVAPDGIPEAFERRIQAGNEARKREGGLMQTIPQGIEAMSTPEGRAKMWATVKKYPAHFLNSLKETVEVPGGVAAGEIDLSTEEGMDRAIGLGVLVGFGRFSKTTRTAQTSGMSVAMGEQVARIERTPTGEIVEVPVGGLPTAGDFVNAARAATDETAPRLVQEKLLQAYEHEGRHPAEVAHDAARDPVIHQRLLSKDPQDMPYGGKPPVPPAPKEPKVPEYSDAQRAVLDKISIGERDAKRPWSFDRLYTEAIDDLHPLKAVSEDAYQMARLTRGAPAKAEYFLERGTFDFNTLKDTGPSLKKILEPVRDDLNGLRAYMTSKRAIEIEASGKKSGIDLEAAKQVIARDEKTLGPIAEQAIEFERATLKYLKDSGMLSEEAFTAMQEANKNYVPFYRVMGAEARGGGVGTSLGPGNPIKRLKGSERKIIDPLESIIKNTYAYISIAERNDAGIKLIDALKKDGFKVETKRPARADPELAEYLKENGVTEPGRIAEFVENIAPAEGEVIRAFRNGVREEVKVNDPELVRAFQDAGRESANMIVRVLAVPARSLRAGAVLTPDFMARNIIGDFLTAFVNSKGLFSPIDTAKGLASVIRKDAHWGDWVKSGGANSTLVSLDRAYLQESLTKLAGETGLMDRAWNMVKHPVDTTLRPLRMLSELAESATRVGEYRKVAKGAEGKEGMQAAGFASREVTLDFARIGASMRSVNMLVAFSNAGIQGLDRTARAFIDRPANTLLKVAGGITLPSVLLWWANHEDKRYQDLPRWQKDLFWIVLTDKWEKIDALEAASKPEHLVRQARGGWEFNNGSIWRIRKPFEVGLIFGSGAERLLDLMVAERPDALKDFGKSMYDIFTPSVMPTFSLPLIDQFANRSTFIDRTLIPADMEKHLPEYQYTPYTTQLSRKLGQIVSAFPGIRESATEPGSPAGPAARALTSPILIENYVRSWTGGLGMYAVGAADLALRKAGVLPDPVTPTPTVADIPFVKAFAVRYPSAGAQPIQDFYDDHEKQQRYFKTWEARAKEGDAEAMQRIEDAGGPQMFVRLDAIKDVLGEHNKMIRDIYKNPQMPAEEKRQLIDGLYYSMIEIGRAGREMQRAVKATP